MTLRRIASLSVWLLAATVIVSNLSVAGAADEPKKEGEKPKPREKGSGGDRGQFMARILDSLNLTDEQKEKIKPILEKGQAARQKWEADNKEKLDAVRAKFREAREKKDADAAKQAGEELRKLMESAPRPDFVALLKDVLTAEQLEKLQKRVDEMKERFKKGPPEGPGGDRPKGEKRPEKKPEA